ncbi:amino acid adenylation domain-containing protein [Pseudoalteromonas sp. SMS1]|uniref:non-ribosomal peptide synthetase n=1 Tax=Pseudoalteromonas sp. SMS1 TaxID=2908894 RepID=UPI001F344B52|nr:non-ribosomal peptide synthetase [Pseudoalteromonas sp. SMS1]MCF2859280.1 amino acid adenylation domain-containing protein [Pseudoalteromonas sp. SMS1]
MTAITIMDHLAQHAAQQPDNIALICVDKKAQTPWSFGELYTQSLMVASHLKNHVVAGDRALILMDTGIEYVTSFLACQYLGVTAIPSFPPESTKAQHIARTVGIAEDSEAAVVLTTARFTSTVETLVEQVNGSKMLVIDEFCEQHETIERHPAKSEEIAFLQYTSGSTAKPKGVMVSHGNLLGNEKAIAEGMNITQDDVLVSWLPLFHDMGLIGGLLQPIYTGYKLVLCSPRYFMERPARWLQLISDYKATMSGGPDFAYRLCIERVKDKQVADLDLSSLRVFFSGAEPIRHDTLLSFAHKYAPQGFKPTALYPCYGLAEGTLFVTGSIPSQGAVIEAFDTRELAAGKAVLQRAKDLRDSEEYTHQVGCGVVASEHQVRITCPTSFDEVAQGHIGEIWASGPSIAVGYWRNEQATQDTFVEHEGKRWLRTGDVGYVHGGQLFISGRQKDLIIMNGHNVYPQDIERAIEGALSFVRQGRVSAFPVPSEQSGEGIGVAIETANVYRNEVPAEQTALIVRDFIITQFGNCPELVVLLDQGGLPKTSSGKLQRSACLKLLQAEKLATYGVFNLTDLQQLSVSHGGDDQHTWDEVAQRLAALWQGVLHYPVNSNDADFFALGGSSIKAALLLAKVQAAFNCQIEPTAVFAAHKFGDFCQLVRESIATKQEQASIPALAQAAYPLSAQQQRQLFLWQLEPLSSAYHIGASLTLKGEINDVYLHRAVAHILAQQDILRHAYGKDASGQWQQQLGAQTLNWQQADFSESSDPEAAATWVETFYQQPFALERGDNFRAALIKLSGGRTQLILVMHHIASDAWSFDLVLADISRYYALLVDGNPLSNDGQRVNYGDFAAWQQQWLSSSAAEEQLTYWQQQLQANDDEELLAPQHPRQPDMPAPMQNQMLKLSYQQVEQLQALAHQHGASLFMLLLSSLQVFFYRFSGKRTPRIGVPVASRRFSELHSLMGFFINTLVQRNTLSAEQSFVEVLSSTKTRAIEAQLNQDLPFEKLVEVMNPDRSLGQNPLFQVMFNHLEQDVQQALELPGVEVEQVAALQQQAQFDLSIDSRLLNDGALLLEFQYNAALYDADYIARVASAFNTLLNDIVKTPKQAIGNLALHTQQAESAEQGCGEGIDLPATPWLQAISEIAQQTPARTAVIYNDQHYSFEWLEQTANRLAHGLIANGFGTESVIGVMQSRKPLMLASTLACLKAGAAYLPLDKLFPVDKLHHMLQDSGCGAILSDEATLPMTFTGVLLSPQTLLSEQHLNTVSPEVRYYDNQTAYLNYTSGSTGKAKGVAIELGALSRYIESAKRFINLQADDVVLQFATANFDAFVEQLFPTWAVGAAVLLRGDALWDAETLYAQAQKHHVAVMDLSAAYWRSISASWARKALQAPLNLPKLRQVHSGGEAMSVAGIQDWQNTGLAQVRLLNTYGPTEIVVEAAIHPCQDLNIKDDGQQSVPLGHALAGRRLYILDDNLEIVPQGHVGQLYVGGDILARGYWAQPDMTATRFIADPFSDTGARMYATGDLVSWQGGELMYHGRNDHQVKVRGFRVELGEIEQQLSQLSDVDTAVVVTEQQSHGLGLIAYIQSTKFSDPTFADRLKRALGERMPTYMVPSDIVVMEKLPINASGKLERQQLPKVARVAQPVSLAENDTERAIAEIWQKHLKTQEIDRHANFFDVGGHSLLLMAVYEELKVQYPNLQMTELFAHPSIASLATLLGSAQSNTAPVTPNKPSGAKQKRGMGAIAARKRKARES